MLNSTEGGSSNEQPEVEAENLKQKSVEDLLRDLDLSTSDGQKEFQKIILFGNAGKKLFDIFPSASADFILMNSLAYAIRNFDELIDMLPEKIDLLFTNYTFFDLRDLNTCSVFLSNLADTLNSIARTVLSVQYYSTIDDSQKIIEIKKKTQEIFIVAKRIFIKYISNIAQNPEYDFNVENPFVSTQEIKLWAKEVLDERYKNINPQSKLQRALQPIVRAGADMILERFLQYQKALEFYEKGMVYARPNLS